MSADRFEWLEAYSAETERWEREQDLATLELLDAWAHRRQLQALVASLPPSRAAHVPRLCGNVSFTADAGGVAADGRRVFEPAGGASVVAMWPAPDASRIVVATTVGSQEAGELRVVDVTTGAALGAPVLYTAWTNVAWSPDASAFYASSIDFRDGVTVGALWRIDRAGAATRIDVDHRGLDLRPDVSLDGRYVMVSVGTTTLRPGFLVDSLTNEARQLPAAGGHFHGVLDDGDYFAVTTVDAPRGRLVRAALDMIGDSDLWEEVAPESDATMRAVSVVGDRLVLSEVVDGCSRLRLLTRDGAVVGDVPLPNKGVGIASSGATPLPGVPMFHHSPDSPTITFSVSTPGTPPVAYSFDAINREMRAMSDITGVATTSERVVTAAGDAGPSAWVTRPAHLDLAGPAAALVIVYGGWNIPNSPQYSPATSAFLAAGGVVVHVVVRGGGERGQEWWASGRREHKQATFDDLYAIVETLIATGTLDPARIALHGGSAGGLAAAVAATQRPDLWAVVAATAPLLDLLRVADGPDADASTIASIREELGDDRDVLSSYSPYEHVHDHLPPMLIGVTADDVRTPAWHGRKYVARAQAAGNRDVRLRVWRNAGHGTGRPTGNQITSDWLSFVMLHLGLEPGEIDTVS